MESSMLPRSPTSPKHPVANLLSPSITDSAIDIDTQDTQDTQETSSSSAPAKPHNTHTTPLTERFATLANLLSNPSTQSHLSQSNNYSSTIHQHLDHIERVLDPRRDITLEIAKQRPRRSSPPPDSLVSPTIPSPQVNRSNTPSSSQPMQSSSATAQDQATDVLENLKTVTEQLQRRRKETLHLNALFTMKCEAMAQRIIALENEVHELESDIFEDTIEIEGLRGTVRGLESWIGRWKRQRESTGEATQTNRPKASRKGRKKKKGVEEAGNEYDNDALIDGVDAWMRGWKDAEEGSRIRAQMRKQRRELRRRRKADARRTDE